MGKFRTFKYLLLPNKTQAAKLDEIIDACSFLRRIIRLDYKNGENIPNDYRSVLEYYKNKYQCLNKVNSSALINEIFMFFDEKNRALHIVKQSFKINYTDFVKAHYPFDDEGIYLPNLGWIKKKNNRKIPEYFSIKSYIITKQNDEKYYILVTTKINESQLTTNVELDKTKIIGLDYSSTYFAVDNFGKKYNLAKQFRSYENKIVYYQRQLSRCQIGSNKYKRTRKLLKKLYKHITNSRNDVLHKLSTNMANKYDYIVVENLDMVEISQHFNLGKATLDNCYARFVIMLDYKMNDRNKKLIKVSKWYPSSKICNKCGNKNASLTLKDKMWTCPNCGEKLDRDINAAINIRNEGRRIIESVG